MQRMPQRMLETGAKLKLDYFQFSRQQWKYGANRIFCMPMTNTRMFTSICQRESLRLHRNDCTKPRNRMNVKYQHIALRACKWILNEANQKIMYFDVWSAHNDWWMQYGWCGLCTTLWSSNMILRCTKSREFACTGECSILSMFAINCMQLENGNYGKMENFTSYFISANRHVENTISD